jgi:hypothetical protein
MISSSWRPHVFTIVAGKLGMGYFGRAQARHAIAAPAMTMTPPAIISVLPALSKDGASSAPGICHIANRPGPLNSMKRPAPISAMAQDFFSCRGVRLCHFIGVSLCYFVTVSDVAQDFE